MIEHARRWQLWVVTFFGAGLLKPAPGTWGSLAATCLLCFLRAFFQPAAWPIFLIAFTLTASMATVFLGPWIEQNLGEDPGPCVIDEAAGIGLTLLALPMVHPLITSLAAFAAFRIFDVTKLAPARQLERLPKGWGILLDDLAAAIYANVLCQIILRAI